MSATTTKATDTAPPPGIYPNTAFDDYLAWPYVSASRLKLASRSLMHYDAGFQGEPSKAMFEGTVAHALVNDPLSILNDYCTMPDYASHPDNKTAKGERSWSAATRFVAEMQENFKKLNHEKQIVDEDVYRRLVGLAKVLSRCPIMKSLMFDGEPEVSIVWDDPASGLRCKSRCDWLYLGQDRSIILDLKTTADVSEFERSIVRYRYHNQMAFYRRAVEVATGRRPEVWICAVETTAPFGHMVAPMDPDALELGAREIDELLAKVKDCKDRGEWPGYEHPETWRLPEWYTKRSAEPVELVLEDGEVVLV